MRLIVGSLTSLVILAGLLAWNSRSGRDSGAQPLIVYCAVALQPPLEEIARAFEAETGVPVQIEFGASQVLLAKLELRRDADLFIPADEEYLRLADGKRLLESSVPLTKLRAVVGVLQENPKGIRTLTDLSRPEVRLALADPKTAAIGRLVKAKLGAQWREIEARTVVMRTTVGDAAADVKLGVADAAFVWDETVRQMPELAAVEFPELADAESQVAIGILRNAKDPEGARRFARYLTASDRGGPVLLRRGYRPVSGEPWSKAEGR